MQAGQVIKTLNEHLELSSSKDAEVSHVLQSHIIPSLMNAAANAQHSSGCTPSASANGCLGDVTGSARLHLYELTQSARDQ